MARLACRSLHYRSLSPESGEVSDGKCCKMVQASLAKEDIGTVNSIISMYIRLGSVGLMHLSLGIVMLSLSQADQESQSTLL
jgi:hypothetical protein